MLKKVINNLVPVIGCSLFILCLWIAILNLFKVSPYLAPGTVTIPIGILFLTVIIISVYSEMDKIITWLKKRKKLLLYGVISLFIIGLVARISFLMLTYVPISDPGNNYEIANLLFTNGNLYENANEYYARYVAIFPHLYAYGAILSLSFKLFGSGFLAVIILNTIFDIIATFSLYYLVKAIFKKRNLSLLAAMFWWLSPFNIIFCSVILPVVIVNASILLALVVIMHIFKKIEKLGALLPLSFVAGLALFFQNIMRPFAIILIFSILAYYILYFIKHSKFIVFRNCLVSLSVIVGVFMYSNSVFQEKIAQVTGYPVNHTTQAWSIFVGSNYESIGRWNAVDKDNLHQTVTELGLNEGLHKLQSEGISRWKKLGTYQAANLLFYKSAVIAGDQRDMIYNIIDYKYFNFYEYPERETRFSTVSDICKLYWFAIMALVMIYTFKTKLRKELNFMSFLSIFTILLFLVSLLLEASSRYFATFLPTFVLMAVAGINELLKSTKTIKA